jgi:hypothetical protein
VLLFKTTTNCDCKPPDGIAGFSPLHLVEELLFIRQSKESMTFYLLLLFITTTNSDCKPKDRIAGFRLLHFTEDLLYILQSKRIHDLFWYNFITQLLIHVSDGKATRLLTPLKR